MEYTTMAIRAAAAILTAALLIEGCRHLVSPQITGWSNGGRACAENVNDDGGIDSTDAKTNLSSCYQGTGILVGAKVKL